MSSLKVLTFRRPHGFQSIDSHKVRFACLRDTKLTDDGIMRPRMTWQRKPFNCQRASSYFQYVFLFFLFFLAFRGVYFLRIRWNSYSSFWNKQWFSLLSRWTWMATNLRNFCWWWWLLACCCSLRLRVKLGGVEVDVDAPRLYHLESRGRTAGTNPSPSIAQGVSQYKITTRWWPFHF